MEDSRQRPDALSWSKEYLPRVEVRGLLNLRRCMRVDPKSDSDRAALFIRLFQELGVGPSC